MKTYRKGRFVGKYDSSTEVNLFKVLKWKLFGKPDIDFGKKSPVPLAVQYTPEQLLQKEDFICWLSHATFLIQLGGKRILIDPVFGDIPFYKRQVDFPYSVEELGKVDYLLVSHVHYDHFDTHSIQMLTVKNPKAVLPLHMSKLLHRTVPSLKSVELDWYESHEKQGLKITLVPAKHWGRRGLFDRNRVLWGGYVLSYEGKNIYFAGDTAPGEHFEEIGRQFEIDYALLPIGAYRPEFIMKHNHLDPQEAFEAFRQLKAKKMVPMHYGTFKLTDEPLDEPLQWIGKIAEANSDKIVILKAGEIYTLTI
ncbi:MBL fold metallo-hydrolase [Sulfurovum riftiae]|uniref:Metallo-beta-lactamase domain-containing protein n=1 Tax=Sulfurovum riftiae TaxID=1630136 RepID=A0A151CED9_9BACT|nr:MBL fold metallo-hydrolase [Sulfurovum riftiae]KYJ85849.1 hypothetical protein AS592_04465 [Sulfurovum riftiae]